MSVSFDELFDQVHQNHSSAPVEKEEALSNNFDELFNLVSSKQPSKAKSLLSAPLKGLIKGAAKFNPLPTFGPISPELGERITEQLLPTREGNAEEILEFTGENLPFAAFGEGSLAKKGLQAASGALFKKGAKEVGLPDWAQDILGSIGMMSPDLAKSFGSKALRPSKKQHAIVDFLRSKGLTDKDITPIIQDKKKLSFVSKAASKYEKRDPWIRGIKNKLGDIFENIREKGSESGFESSKDLLNFEEEFHKKLDKLPRMYRRIIQKEVDDLMQRPLTFTSLHDFDKAVNAIVGDIHGGKAAIGILKEPVKNAQKKINPILFSDLQKTNETYARLQNFSDKMTKKNWESIVGLGQLGNAIYGALTLNPKALAASGSVAAGRYAAKQLVSNPRLQNIHLKMWDAFLKNKIPQTIKLFRLFQEEIQKAELIEESETP